MPLTPKEELELLQLQQEEDLDTDDNAPEESGAEDPGVLAKMGGAARAAGYGMGQGVTLGFADEINAGIGAVGEKVLDAVHGNPYSKPIDDIYREERTSERNRFAKAKEENPAMFMGGEIIGSLAIPVPGGPAAKGATLGAKALRGAAQGAAMGGAMAAGASKADLTEGEMAGLAEDVGEGAAFGGAFGGALPVVAEGVSKFADKAGNLGRKTFGALMGTSDDGVKARMAEGKDLMKTETYAQLGEMLPDDVAQVQKKIGEDSAKAWEKLKKSNDPREGAFAKDEVMRDLKRIAVEAKITGGGAVGKANKAAVDTLMDIALDVQNLGGNIRGKLLSQQGVESIVPKREFLSEAQVKEIIQSLDGNINWDNPAAGKTNELLEHARDYFDDILKSQNVDYKQAMIPVAKNMRLVKNLKRGFGLQEVPGEGLRPQDVTATKMQMAPSEKRAITQETLEELKGVTGSDYLAKSKKARLAKEFEGGSTQGSRRVNVGGISGAGVGSAVGGAVAGWPGAAVGSVVGGTIGGIAGAYMDKYGGKVAGELIDFYVKNNPARLGKYATVLTKAAEKGTRQLVISDFLLQQRDPEYGEMISSLDEQ